MQQPNPNPAPPPSTIELKHGETLRTFHLSGTELGLAIMQQIFSGFSYPIMPMSGSVQTILDIGANIGAASVYFSLYYPDARILAFEPLASTFQLLMKNIAGLEKVSAFPYGLSDQSTSRPLYLGREDPVTNSLHASPLNTDQSVQVSLRASDEVMREQQIDVIDILKIDTEGCEVAILSRMADWLPRVGCLYVEYHNADDRIAIDRLLADTHWLCHGKISSPHRGEFVYLSRARMPSLPKWEEDKIDHELK